MTLFSIKNKSKISASTATTIQCLPPVTTMDIQHVGTWENLSPFLQARITKEQYTLWSSLLWMNWYGHREGRISRRKYGISETPRSLYLNGVLVKIKYQIWDGRVTTKLCYGLSTNNQWLCGIYATRKLNLFTEVI